jgi:RHS repeat-associated protein
MRQGFCHTSHDNTQSGSPISTQYFDQGAIISGTPYYYVRDRLGSVTELVTSTGTIASQYTYDPYGNRTTVSGSIVPDIGYSGYFYHKVSGLDFTRHRAYDPIHARWLNRDPIAEAGGVNLYAYVDGNPISRIDPLGLMYIAARAELSSLFLVFHGAPGELPTFEGIYQINDAHCLLWCFFSDSEFENALSPTPAPMPPLPPLPGLPPSPVVPPPKQCT